MRRSMALLATGMALVLAGLAAEPAAQEGRKPGKGGSGGGSADPLPASLLLDDATGDKVLSDDGILYLDGVERVSSTIDGGSDYDLTLGSGRKGPARSVTYVFDAEVQAGSCVGNECSCSALAGSPGHASASGYLHLNLEPDSALCAMGVGTSGAGRATALIGNCRVTWNPDAPSRPGDLDGITITRTGTDTWSFHTDGDGHAWLWSEGRRNARIDEGIFAMPFGGEVAILSGACS